MRITLCYTNAFILKQAFLIFICMTFFTILMICLLWLKGLQKKKKVGGNKKNRESLLGCRDHLSRGPFGCPHSKCLEAGKKAQKDNKPVWPICQLPLCTYYSFSQVQEGFLLVSTTFCNPPGDVLETSWQKESRKLKNEEKKKKVRMESRNEVLLFSHVVLGCRLPPKT